MFLVWFLFSCSNAFSDTSPLPEPLVRVQEAYLKKGGVVAFFDQLTLVKSTRQTKKSQGKIWIKRPNQLRWETLEPDANILVSDGKTFWFYTPPFEKGERGQVIIKKSKQVQTQFLNGLLSGSFDFGSETEVKELGAGRFIIKPKAGTAGDVETAEIGISKRESKIQEVVLIHTTGNRTEIKLKDIELQSNLDSKLFRFVPDRNTDRIQE